MVYPATLTEEEDGTGWNVLFPDVPEAITCGETREEAIFHAADALEAALDFYFDDGRLVPLPSAVMDGQVGGILPAEVAERVLRHNREVATKTTG